VKDIFGNVFFIHHRKKAGNINSTHAVK